MTQAPETLLRQDCQVNRAICTTMHRYSASALFGVTATAMNRNSNLCMIHPRCSALFGKQATALHRGMEAYKRIRSTDQKIDTNPQSSCLQHAGQNSANRRKH